MTDASSRFIVLPHLQWNPLFVYHAFKQRAWSVLKLTKTVSPESGPCCLLSWTALLDTLDPLCHSAINRPVPLREEPAPAKRKTTQLSPPEAFRHAERVMAREICNYSDEVAPNRKAVRSLHVHHFFPKIGRISSLNQRPEKLKLMLTFMSGLSTTSWVATS